MAEYMVRWKYAANSLLNRQDVDTHWYYQFYSTKEEATDHYVTLMTHTIPAARATIQIFTLVPFAHQPKSQMEPEKKTRKRTQKTNRKNAVLNAYDREKRDQQILSLFTVDKLSRQEIMAKTGVSYHVVCAVIAKAAKDSSNEVVTVTQKGTGMTAIVPSGEVPVERDDVNYT